MLRRTKIVATLGPATDAPGVLEEVIRARRGRRARQFLARRGRPTTAAASSGVRQAAAAVGKHVAVLGDLQGPKIRIERFAGGRAVLTEGEPFALDPALDPHDGTDRASASPTPDLARDVQPGDELILGDGQIELRVSAGRRRRASSARVHVGGEVSRPQGHQPPRRRPVGQGADRQGPRGRAARRGARRRLPRRVVRAPGRRHRGGARAARGRRQRRAHRRQDRAQRGDPAPRGDHPAPATR